MLQKLHQVISDRYLISISDRYHILTLDQDSCSFQFFKWKLFFFFRPATAFLGPTKPVGGVQSLSHGRRAAVTRCICSPSHPAAEPSAADVVVIPLAEAKCVSGERRRGPW